MNPLGVLLVVGFCLVLGCVFSTVFSSAVFASTNRRPASKKPSSQNAKRAFVACADPDASYRLFQLVGIHDCRTAFLPYGGDRACRVACLGYSTCVDICPRNALQRGAAGKPLIGDDCDGCGLCVQACPTGAMTLIDAAGPEPKPCHSVASNEERRTYGSLACIERPYSAILTEKALQKDDNKIDYDERAEAMTDRE